MNERILQCSLKNETAGLAGMYLSPSKQRLLKQSSKHPGFAQKSKNLKLKSGGAD